VEITYFKGSRGAKECLHYLFRRDAPPKPLNVKGVQFSLIYSLKIDLRSIQDRPLAILTDPIQNRSRINPAGIIAKPALVNSGWFKHKPVILFLNKIDLFREKLALSPVSAHFPDYYGADTDYDAAVKYFADRFRGINRTAGREIYIHYTNATDTTLLKAIMQSVHDMIIRKNLNNLIYGVSDLCMCISFSNDLSA
jgi:hypothetical protein